MAYSFTYNHCVNYVQRDKHKKNEKRILDESNIPDNDFTDEIGDDFIFQLKADKLKRALEIIDPNDKMILLMKYQDDMSIKDLQHVLQLGESAVKMRVKRAKEKVIKTYESI